MKSVGILTLGCKVNTYESEFVINELKKAGYIIKDFDDICDVYIINTCTVTNNSDSKSKKMIRQAIRRNPNACVVAMGCFIQANPDISIDGLDILIGNKDKSKIVELLDEYFAKKEILKKQYVGRLKEFEDMYISDFPGRTRAFIKIQDGCDNFCSYCLIPYIRGRSRSRNPEDVLSEINDLINNGYKEVVLTGVDMASYGLDLENKTTLSDLLEMILEKFDNLYRLRISSLETSLIDDKFLSLLEKFDNFANHLHIPLQSGSKKVVKLMNRKYDVPEFKEKVKKIRNIRPNISITTDVIVGFPGEEEEDFLESYNTCKEIGFSKIHVFPFSSREGTIASKMKNQVDGNTKKDRVHRLLALSSQMEENYYKEFYGKEVEFLFEEFDDKLQAYKGHSSNYLEAFCKSEANLKNIVKKILFTKENSIKI